MEQMRSEFEAWFAAIKYHVIVKEIAWQAWSDSRAAIEIEAPAFIDSRGALAKGFTVDYSNGFGDGMDAYEVNIRAAGLRVKEK